MICLVAHQIFAPTDLEKQFIPETAVEVNEDSKEKTDWLKKILAFLIINCTVIMKSPVFLENANLLTLSIQNE